MPSLCALLGNVEITICPGEVTSTQELRAVSSLRMHSPSLVPRSFCYAHAREGKEGSGK